MKKLLLSAIATSALWGQTARLPVPAISLTLTPNGPSQIHFRGVNYAYNNPLGLFYYSNVSGPDQGNAIPTCSGTLTNRVITRNCNLKSVSFTTVFTYTVLPDGHTIRVDIATTNHSPTEKIIALGYAPFGITSPYIAASSSLGVSADADGAITYANFGTGQWAIWNNSPASPSPVGYFDTKISPTCGNPQNVCTNYLSAANIAPLTTKVTSFSLKFTSDAGAIPGKFAPEAFAAYANAYPYLVNHPDRRPIMAWFMSDGGHKCSTNPRGWFNMNSPCLDVANIARFQSIASAQADSLIAAMNARPVRPQGIVMWDAQGQEFKQPMGYLGEPRAGAFGYAPEMYSAEGNANGESAMDIIVRKFRDAGYSVGMTLRPQSVLFFSALPATCVYNANAERSTYGVLVSGSYGMPAYTCNPDGASWKGPGFNGLGTQTSFATNDVTSVVDLLSSKIGYAKSKWGMTLFYVDSTVWIGGAPMQASVWQQLQAQYPDILLMPEEAVNQGYSASLPYNQPAIGGGYGRPIASVMARFSYPNANIAVKLDDCAHSVSTCWLAKVGSFSAGQRIGDIALYSIPNQSGAAAMNLMENMILSARSAGLSLSVTDAVTGAVYNYSEIDPSRDEGYPGYPLKLREYFAPSDEQLADSTTYCENGQFYGESSCTLNLTNKVRRQVRFYDFSGNLIITRPPSSL